ncbi:MAG: tRNA uridine-5-carboxymethylaminomethyl(34) synthesis GTPase MnmE, partial [Clostridiales bacterium]|nr:tRNA uridine-5-carboxymethylaminomethyl(34) synthesis GTPase MnmE [Clostridiales bacterium]
AIVLNRRQHIALLNTKQAIASAVEAMASGVPEDVAAIDLKQAWSFLGELTGEALQTALVEKIFSTFCLGK